MQGVLRLYLAACVVHGHMWLPYYAAADMFDFPLFRFAANAAQAVAAFFIVSGFVAAMQLETRFSDGARIHVWRYYRDRLVRIYPTYLLIVALAAPIYFAWSRYGAQLPWGDTKQQVAYLAFNLFPPLLDVWQAAGGQAFQYAVIPVSWSLGVELFFYAAAPALFLICRNGPVYLLVGMLVISEPFMRMRPVALNYLDPLFNAKYFIAGMLAYFIAQRLPQPRFEGWFFPVLLTALFLLVVRTLTPYVDPMAPSALGFYALVLVSLIASANLTRTSKADLVLGHISYPLFLVHIPIMWAAKGLQIGQGPGRVAFVWGASLTASVAIYVLFDRLINQRRVTSREQARVLHGRPHPVSLSRSVR